MFAYKAKRLLSRHSLSDSLALTAILRVTFSGGVRVGPESIELCEQYIYQVYFHYRQVKYGGIDSSSNQDWVFDIYDVLCNNMEER